MEYPFGHHHGHHHHHRRDDDDDRREEFPPPGHRPPYDEPPPPQVDHVFHTSHVGGPPPMEPNYGRPHYPPPPMDDNYGRTEYPPPMDDNYGRTNYPPPPMEENYGGSYNRPPPRSDYYDAPPPPPTSGYPSVEHVSHESGSGDRHHDRHRFQPHVPSAFHHQTSDPELMDKPSFRVYTKADTNYSLTIRDEKVVLASNDPSDPFQHWYKDEKFSTKVKDEEGFPSFALVNKASGLALKHSIGASHPVQLTPYNPDVLDASILWTESRDVGDGYRAVRMVNNINLNLDAWNADKEHGGVRDGTTVCLWEWWKGDNRNQHWKIVRFSSLVPHLHARIADFDPYLEKQALEALNSSLEAYTHNPEEVTNAFNKEVGNALLKYKSLRRHLKEKDKCMATNPIDRCWRCDKNWAENRMDLEECARGFGHKTTGGKNGKYYVVTDESDDNVQEPKPGTLRHAVIQEEPLWIIFEKSMVIKLQQELMITSNKTIDGRGVAVHIAYGAGLTIQFVHNVIIHNIRIQNIISTNGGMIRDSVNHIGLRTVSDGDGISIFGSNHIWIDHCTLSECTDGLIDAIMASTAITISNCKFNYHNDVMLLGATDAFPQDAIMQVTVAFNRFGEGLIQRMPRCRWGFFHVVNNDYTHWQMYAIGGSAHPTIISQGNRFKAADNPNTKQVTKRDYATESEWKKWQWVSEGDSFLNGAYFVESGPQEKKKTALTKNHKIKFKPGSHAGRLTRFAGVLKCKPGIPC